MKFRIVEPYPADVYQNDHIISKLKGYKRPEYTNVEPLIRIPVFGDVDVEAILEEQKLRKPPATANGTNEATDSSKASVKVNEAVEQPLKLYVSLDKLLPQNKQQQKATVALHNCPTLRKNAMEKVLEIIVSVAPAKGLFLWTELAEGDLAGSNNVFVRFSNIQLATIFIEVLPRFNEVFKVDVSSQVEQASGTGFDETKIETALSEVSNIIANRKNYGKNVNKTGTEDLDKVMQHYSTYKVDNADLVDIPKEMRDKIVGDIVRFRSRVLTIEKEARKKELEVERRKAKAKLTSIFQGIKESGSLAETPSGEHETDEQADEEELETDKMTEEDYAKYIQDEQSRQEDAAYLKKQDRMKYLEEHEMSNLLQQLKAVQEYEDNLVDNKFSYMEEFKLFLDLDMPKINPILSSKVQLYYNDHAEYLRVRNFERTKEEQLDKEDAQEEEKEVQTPAPSTKKVTETVATESNGSSLVVLELLSDKLSSLKKKISDLIEEYLGVKEEILIDFIYDFLVENNLSEKESLIAELQETLDDDSLVVVEEIHKFLLI